MAEIHAENVVRERSISRIQRRRPRRAPPPPSPLKTAPSRTHRTPLTALTERKQL